MSTALEGTPKRGVTLTEQANGRRIGRSMFIGHTVGYLLIFVALNVLLNGVHFSVDGLKFSYAWNASITPSVNLSSSPPLLHLNLLAGNLIVSGLLFAASVLIWCDLIVRRRHDRGRSGIDGAIWMLALVASQITWLVDPLPEAVTAWLDYAVYAGALYLFVVLVLLPGNRHENRYGAVPRPD